jgi:hypothetical protein
VRLPDEEGDLAAEVEEHVAYIALGERGPSRVQADALVEAALLDRQARALDCRSLALEPKARQARKALLDGLSERGFNLEVLTEIGRMINAEKIDLFAVLAHIAYWHDPEKWSSPNESQERRRVVPLEEA